MIPIVDSVLKIVNKFVPDQESRDKLKADLTKEVSKQMEMQKSIIENEQKSESYLTRNWRPLFMVLCAIIIGSHWILYDIVPYVRTTFDLNFFIPQDPGLPQELWYTIRLGLGG